MGFTYFVIFSADALGFWYGAKLVRGDLADCCAECQPLLIQNNIGIDCSLNFSSGISNDQLVQFYQTCTCDNLAYSPGVMVAVSICEECINVKLQNFF